MDNYQSLSSSSGEEELHLLSAQHKVQPKKISKQLQYYYRRTKDKQKRKYRSFTDQENPSRQLKRYHATMANSSGISADSAACETTSDNCDNYEFGTNACNTCSLHHAGSEDDDASLDATSFTNESEESSLLTEGDSSRPSESEDFEESQGVNLHQELEILQSQEEEPLYRGSKISKILSFVLIGSA